MAETLTASLENRIAGLLAEAETALIAAADVAALEAIRVQYLGKQGSLTEQLKSLGGLPPEERPRVGKLVNDAKEQLQGKLADRKQTLESSARAHQLAAEKIDITLPGRGARM